MRCSILPKRSGLGCIAMTADRALAMEFSLQNLPDTFFVDPYPVYRALREHAPVRRMPDGSVFLSRHADLLAVYRDTALFSSDKREEFRPKFGSSPLFDHHTNSLVFNDAPFHLRVRKILMGALSPSTVASYENSIHALCERLLDRIQRNGGGDAVNDYAAAIPVEVISNLLGVPVEDREPLRDWSLAILGALEPVLTPEVERSGNAAVTSFVDYLGDLVAARRRSPGDPASDILTRLILADGVPLDAPALLHNCIFLLNAGHETTTNLIANGVELLARFPDERQRLRADPSLSAKAVEEVLRYESPNQLGNRRALADTSIAGTAIKAGDLITLGIGAANRDEREFDDAEAFRIDRQPNRHLAFASGPHQCAGLGLARIEGRVALYCFMARFPNYEIGEASARARRARFRGFDKLPLVIG